MIYRKVYNFKLSWTFRKNRVRFRMYFIFRMYVSAKFALNYERLIFENSSLLGLLNYYKCLCVVK